MLGWTDGRIEMDLEKTGVKDGGGSRRRRQEKEEDGGEYLCTLQGFLNTLLLLLLLHHPDMAKTGTPTHELPRAAIRWRRTRLL